MYLTRYMLTHHLNDSSSVLVNTLSGAIDVIDNRYLPLLADPAALTPDCEIWKPLHDRGYIFPSRAAEERELRRLFNEYTRTARPMSFVICPTYSCNLRCKYCFEGSLPQEHPRVLEAEEIDAIFAAIDRLGAAGSHIQLFGGEPLLPSTHKAVKRILELSRARGLTVSTITNGTPTIAVAQVSRLTVATAADADVFSVTINGVIVAAGTSAGTDATVQRDAIEALMLANAYFVANFTVADQSTDALDITALQDGEPFGVEVAITTTSVWTWSEPTANIVGTQMKALINGVETHLAADSTSIATERDAFLALLVAEAFHTGILTFAAGGAGEITITADVAGVPFIATVVNETIDGVAGVGTWTIAATTANVTGNPIPFGYGMAFGASVPLGELPSATGFDFAGIAIFKAKIAPNDGTGAKYEAGEAVSTGRRNVVWVLAEVAITLGDDVFLRHTIGSATELPGRWRNDADGASADQVAQARWVTETTAPDQLAQLEINLP